MYIMHKHQVNIIRKCKVSRKLKLYKVGLEINMNFCNTIETFFGDGSSSQTLELIYEVLCHDIT